MTIKWDDSKALVIVNEEGFFFEQIVKTLNMLRAYKEFQEGLSFEGTTEENAEQDALVEELGEQINYWELVLQDNEVEEA